MSIYYEDDLVTLYHGDCREIAAWLEADVLVTDPPYGMDFVSTRSQRSAGSPIVGDRSTEARDRCLARWGAARPGLVFGTWKQPRPALAKQVLIWDRTDGNGTGSGSLHSPWGYTHEEVYVIGEWPPVEPGGRAREGGTPTRSGSVLRAANYNTQSADRPNHPTPKPVGLMESLIRKCPPGAIADPFAGSGSTLLAAKNQGRLAIGVELDEAYCELAANRLAQDTLFGGAA